MIWRLEPERDTRFQGAKKPSHRRADSDDGSSSSDAAVAVARMLTIESMLSAAILATEPRIGHESGPNTTRTDSQRSTPSRLPGRAEMLQVWKKLLWNGVGLFLFSRVGGKGSCPGSLELVDESINPA